MADALFDNPKPASKPAAPPKWVVDELVRTHGCKPQVVRTWHAKQAFAVLFGMRKKKEKPAEHRASVASRLLAASAADDATPTELHDLLAEAYATLDRPELVELCRVTAALLSPPT